MFVYGTQYLRGATPSRDQWDRDMYNMKSLGFNTIRAWLVWNTIERREGDIDYDYIGTFLDTAKKNGLDVGLLFHMHACPAWAVKKFSKYFYVDENNLPFEPAVRPNTPGGGWPGLCFDNEEVRLMEKEYIEKVVSYTKNFENVSFYEPMNEPHQWIDYIKNPSKIFCYCDASVGKFQKWLERKYGDVENLNTAWGMFYNSFDEVRPPRWFSSYSDYTDWRIFTMDNIVEEISFRTDVIRSCDTKPVIAHAWGGGAVTCAQLGGMAFDDWKNAKVFDKWGYSAFPYSTAECSALGMGSDATRCAAGGKEFWQSELGAGIEGTSLDINGRIDDDTFDNFSLESLRHGAKGLLYWQYRKERFGMEFGGYALTDYDGGPTNLTKRASNFGRMLGKYGDLFNNASQDKAEVALVFSIRSYIAAWSSSGKANNRFAVDSLSGYYKMFWEENIATDIIHEQFCDDLSAYKLIVLPSSYAISPDFAKKLKEYVKNGGCVISDPFFGAYDETMALSYEVPGFSCSELFGAKEDDIKCEKSLSLYRDGEQFDFCGNHHRENFKLNTAKALYTYADGTPAITENAYGKGKAIMSGINLGLCYSSKRLVSDDLVSTDSANTSKASKAIVLDICKTINIKENPCTAPEVKATYLKTDGNTDSDMIILINSASEARNGSYPLEGQYSECEDIFGNAKCSVENGMVSFTLDANKSAVIKLLKK